MRGGGLALRARWVTLMGLLQGVARRWRTLGSWEATAALWAAASLSVPLTPHTHSTLARVWTLEQTAVCIERVALRH